MEPLAGEGAIDAGAEEELFRQWGHQAAAQALAKRWQVADEPQPRSCQCCGGDLNSLGERSKRLLTVCGPVAVRRRVYYCRRCRRTEVPLDERLRMDASGVTPGLMRIICRTVLELPYQQSEALLSDTLGFRPCSAREMERIAKAQGQGLEQQSQRSHLQLVPGRSRAGKPVYALAIDGTMIPGLPDPQQHRLNWHEVKLATLFDPRGIEPTVYVAGRENAESFGIRLWNQLQMRHLDASRFRLILGDGAPWIWNLVGMHLPGVPQLLDFYHAAEHLYQTAQALWPKKTAHSWCQRRLDQLLENRQENFFAALKLLARRHQTEDPEVSPERLLHYFQDNQERLNYQWATNHHLPIGSGVVESAARHIVQQRLKQSGMRWSDCGAQAILNLRTLHRNGQFEQHWESYAESSVQ